LRKINTGNAPIAHVAHVQNIVAGMMGISRDPLILSGPFQCIHATVNPQDKIAEYRKIEWVKRRRRTNLTSGSYDLEAGGIEGAVRAARAAVLTIALAGVEVRDQEPDRFTPEDDIQVVVAVHVQVALRSVEVLFPKCDPNTGIACHGSIMSGSMQNAAQAPSNVNIGSLLVSIYSTFFRRHPLPNPIYLPSNLSVTRRK
jgi:hypothetical protein